MMFIKYIGLRVLLTQRFSEKKDLDFWVKKYVFELKALFFSRCLTQKHVKNYTNPLIFIKFT